MWQIPLFGGTRLSVGFVSRDETLTETDLDRFISEHGLRSNVLRARATDGTTTYDRLHSRKGFARRAKSPATMDYILLGDAYMFVDPIYSVGTSIATNKARELALLLNQGPWTETKCAGFRRRYEQMLADRSEAFLSWYDDGVRSNDPSTARVKQYFPELTDFQAGIAWHYSVVVQGTLRHCRMIERGEQRLARAS